MNGRFAEDNNLRKIHRIFAPEKLLFVGRRLVRQLVPIKARIYFGNNVRYLRGLMNRRRFLSAEEISQLFDRVEVVREVESTNLQSSMEVLILCSRKHLNKLQISLEQARKLYGEALKVTILHEDSPESDSYSRSLAKSSTIFLNEKVFKQDIEKLERVLGRFNPDRYTWVLQQCLKTLYVAQSRAPVLILDCDTLLTRNIDFVGNGKSVLLVGSKPHSKFHYPYSIHVEKYLGKKASSINFVHHCQLQYPEIVREIYSLDPIKGLESWLLKGLVPFEFSSVSEFQTYGEFVLQRYPETVKLYSHEHCMQGIKVDSNQSYRLNVLTEGVGGEHLSRTCAKACDLLTWYWE
jgi:hypothetical protein